MDADVIVAGGGPVGLMLAAELRLHRVAVLVAERLAGPSGLSKAAGLYARSAETMELRGLNGRIRQRAVERFTATGEEEWTPERLARGAPQALGHFAGIQKLRHELLDTTQPGLLRVDQADLEDVLAERATELGARLRRGCEVVGVEQDGSGVTVALGGDRWVRGRYLVGCDGAHSTVRRRTGFGFPGSPPTMTCRMADIQVPELLADPGPGHHRTATGYLLVARRRVMTTEFDRPPEDRYAPMTVEELLASISRVLGRRVRGAGPAGALSRFTDTTRLAEPYRIGRVLLAGDAAHVQLPGGGQGLNLGLQDAVNLGWKLAATVRGWAPEGLLDSYGIERRPVAARVLDNTRAQAALMNPDPAMTPLRELFGALLDFDEVNRYIGAMIAALDVRYDLGAPGGDRLVGSFLPDLTLATGAGVRSARDLLRGARPVLLDLADDAELRASVGGWRDRVDVVTASAAPRGASAVASAASGRGSGRAAEPASGPAGVEPTAAVARRARALLVRPDGYMAWTAGDATEPLPAALRRWFGPPAR